MGLYQLDSLDDDCNLSLQQFVSEFEVVVLNEAFVGPLEVRLALLLLQLEQVFNCSPDATSIVDGEPISFSLYGSARTVKFITVAQIYELLVAYGFGDFRDPLLPLLLSLNLSVLELVDGENILVLHHHIATLLLLLQLPLQLQLLIGFGGHQRSLVLIVECILDEGSHVVH